MRFGLNALAIQAAAVVGDFDHYLAGLMVRAQQQSRRRGLARAARAPAGVSMP